MNDSPTQQDAYEALYGRASLDRGLRRWIWRTAVVNALVLVGSLTTVTQRSGEIGLGGDFAGSYAGHARPGIGARIVSSAEMIMPWGPLHDAKNRVLKKMTQSVTGEIIFGRSFHLAMNMAIEGKKQAIEMWVIGKQGWMRSPLANHGDLLILPDTEIRDVDFHAAPPKFGMPVAFTRKGTERRNGALLDHWVLPARETVKTDHGSSSSSWNPTVDLWIDHNDGYLREMQADGTSPSFGAADGMSMKMTLQLVDIGSAVHIERPAGAERAKRMEDVMRLPPPPQERSSRMNEQGQIFPLAQLMGGLTGYGSGL